MRHLLVQNRVVHRDDLTVHFHRIGNPDAVVIKEAGKRLSDDGLARPRRSLEEEDASGQHRGAQLVQRLGTEYQVSSKARLMSPGVIFMSHTLWALVRLT